MRKVMQCWLPVTFSLCVAFVGGGGNGAWAEASATVTSSPPATTAPSVSDEAPPFGSPCAYPPLALSSSAQGITRLSFHLGTDGQLSNVTVRESSGNPDLDSAAVACVARWHAGPTQLARTGDLRGLIQWLIPKTATAPAQTAKGEFVLGEPHMCGWRWYPPRLLREKVGGVTKLRFTIKTDGTIDDIEVAQSSGHFDLDEAAKHCATGWLYMPALRDGKPVEVPWDADVLWAPFGVPPTSSTAP